MRPVAPIALLLASLVSITLATAAPAGAAEASVSRVALPSARLSVQPGAAAWTLRLEGAITPAVAKDLAEALQRLPAGMPLVLELDSPGGYTSAGYAMIDRLMAERAAGRHLTTRVRTGSSCESMCVGLFMAGDVRQAGSGARFMVHAPRGLNSGTVTLKSTARMIERLVALGASAEWIERVRAAGGFSGRMDYHTNAADLTREAANVVTVLAD